MNASPGPFRRFRDRSRARRDGRRDGLLGIPTVDEVAHPPALLQIAQRAEEAIAELAGSWAGDDARLRRRLGTTRRELRTAEHDVDDATAEVTGAERRHQTVDNSDTFAAQSTTQGGGVRIGPRAYMLAILAILIAEFPLNAIAFRLFGEAEVLTWVMTASLAVTLVLCAHGLGTFLRVPHPSMAERRWIVVLLALPLLTIVAIAVIRSRYLALEAEVTGLDVLGPVVGSFVFLVINLLIYTGATMLSYLAHAPGRHVPDEATVAKRELREAKQLLGDATRQVLRQQEALTQADAASQEALLVTQARAREVIAYFRGLMAVYCAANLRARGNPGVPAVLRELPKIDVPAVLRDPEIAVPEEDVLPVSMNGHVPDAEVSTLVGGKRSGSAS